ncbi:phage tail protein [Paraburkholderia sediminicola]|uniref:phage tail protein n=1 Tax=Paraburkholderia sediminicola TaxID=458836 RepID=UPI0038BD335E
MIKPASLRAALVAAIPSLATDPERLTVFIDAGHIAGTGTRTPSFEYRYTAHALVMDFAGEADHVFIAIVEWARANQPDLVTNADQRESGITFEADILNNQTVDLSIKLQLTESVVVSTDASGKRTIRHIDDSADHWLG